ncbi:hypothetical protein Cni_G22933 [Canna indica]|uniref:Peroxidase n=1 Tax=Canna indica TaxID=4628 RepID=A0AAQ3KW42_9LILI|nr:hypothetical protein Cni_G22933 [Canna indica]
MAAAASVSKSLLLVPGFLCLLAPASISMAQLSPSFYSETCPALEDIVALTMTPAVLLNPRTAAFILRLFFHDCFVNGCDASVLLDDTPTFTGEKNAGPNANSLGGFEVIDDIKTAVELLCPGTVSCADILALAVRDGVALLGGPSWTVPLGRRDTTTASQSAANRDLPGPGSTLAQLVAAFAAKGLSAREMTALSGAHTIGLARCVNFRAHVFGDADVDPDFATQLRESCPASGGDDGLAPLDEQTATAFDNAFYGNLVAFRGLLHSDQELFNNGSSQESLVRRYAADNGAFARDFAAAMVRMGNISPLTGSDGEIRLDCRRVN